jgi:hypothetical protein
MKRKVLLLLVLATLVAGGAFAQKVGDTVDVLGKKYDVKEAKDGRLVLQLAATLDGDWQAGGFVISFNGNNAVFKQCSPSDVTWKDAIKKGYIKVGDQALKKIKKTGDLTWSGQIRQVQYNKSDPDVATSANFVNTTIKLSADGKTFASSTGTWTRQ